MARLGQNPVNHFAFGDGQTLFPAIEGEGQAFVVEA